jgi:hypothetical protein
MEEQTQSIITESKWKIWFKKVGWIGFFFFLIKGLLWLIIPFLIAKGCMS